MPLVHLVLIAAGLSVAMALAWLVQRITRSSGWVDAVWSATAGIGGLIAIPLAPGGDGGRKILLAALVALWSLRLGLHIARRTIGAGDDPRYAALQLEWGMNFSFRLFWFLQVQAVAAFILVLAVYCAALNPLPFPGVADFVAVAIAIVALVGEAVSDAQLSAFRKQSTGKKAVCEVGLWRWSRHPNYFFEWLWWCSWPIFAFSTAGIFGFAGAFLAPVMMYWLLVHVSGIPPLEAHMLETRGDEFRALQARVNAFFPGPRHENS
jgi:steroid 5-alpha reductase family enzyme